MISIVKIYLQGKLKKRFKAAHDLQPKVKFV